MVFAGYRSRWQAFAQDVRGSNLIEFALSTVVLMSDIFGVMDMSRALFAHHFVASVARDASRYAMVRGSSWNNAACTTTLTFSCEATNTDVTNFVKGQTIMGFPASNLTVTTTWPGTTATGAACDTSNGVNDPGCIVSVQVSYSFNFVLPFLPKNALVMKSKSSVPITQ